MRQSARFYAALWACALAACASGCKRKPARPKPRRPEPTLRQQLDAFWLQFRRAAPKGQARMVEAGIAAVRASGVESRALTMGQKAPLFTLLDEKERPVSLAKMLQDGPVVLLWFQGDWRPYCNLTLHAYDRAWRRFRALGATLLAVSPQLTDAAAETKRRNRLHFPILCDESNRVARAFGLTYRVPKRVAAWIDERVNIERYNGDRSFELPMPATYVIDQQGVIRYAFVSADYRRRAEPEEVIRALRRLTGRR